MINHITALGLTLAIYLFLAATCLGWGNLLIIALRIRGQFTESHIVMIWLGWASTVLVFQALHIFFPLTVWVAIPVFASGMLFSISPLRKILHQVRQKSIFPTIVYVGVLIIAAIWIASRSMLPPTMYDSGLYHFNTLRWINSYAIVPGLGNLHERLAFNHSFFIYAATLNFHPFLNHGRSLANSFIFLLTFAQIISRLNPVFQNSSLLSKSHPFIYASDILSLPILLYLALSSDGLAAPVPDLASTLMQLSMFLMLVQGLGEWMEGNKEQEQRVAVLAILATTAVTIKLSNLTFSFLIFIICLAYTFHSQFKSAGGISAILKICLPSFVIIMVWCVRGFILSGCPLFPSTIGHVSFVDWAVPLEKVENTANWVYSWARQPRVHWSKVLGNWDWLGPWYDRVKLNIACVVYPIISSISFFILAAAFRCFTILKKKHSTKIFDFIILLPVVSGLIFWFFTAPEPRFANALFWLLSLSTALLLLSSLKPLFIKKRLFIVVIFAVFMVLNFYFIFFTTRAVGEFKSVSFSVCYPVKSMPLVKKKTSSGLVVYTPKKGDQAWDSPLPSTPHFNPDLRLRIPGKLDSGFTVRAPQKNSE